MFAGFWEHFNEQAPIVPKLKKLHPTAPDVQNHRINLYPLDAAIGSSNTYPLDSDLSCGSHYPTFE